MAHFQVCYKYYGLLLVLLFLCMFIPCMDWDDGRVTERCTLCAENMSYCQCFDSTVSHPGLFNVNSCCNCTEYLAVKKTNKKTPANTSDWYNENCCAGYLAVKKTKMKMSPTSSRNGHNENSSTKHLAVKKTNMKTPAASTSDGYNENSTASCQDDSNLNKGEVKSEAIVSSTQWMCCCLVVFAALFVSLFIVLYKKLKQQTISTKQNEKMKDCYISYSDPAPSDFLLDEISPLTKASSRLMGIKLKKHNERGTLSDLDHLFEFRRDSCFRQTYTACPALSLASHFASGTFGQPVSTVELHKEGARLATFKDFPTNVPISAIRLAQTGFYYTMERDVVKCFSCGVTHQGWQLGDRPALIHASISPNCALVRGFNTTNLSLPLLYTNPPSYQGSTTSSTSSMSLCDEQDISGAPGAPSLAQSVPSTAEEAPAEPASATTSAPFSQPSPGTSNLPAVAEGTGTSSSTAPGSLPSRRLDLAGSVYPLYSQMDARKQSYDKWPEGQGHPKVNELISLGFFYAGYADCVRCFFCGIGLKSWEPGDIPAEVHARWRPTCEYLRWVKGDQFVDQVANGGRNVSSGEPSEQHLSETIGRQTTIGTDRSGSGTGTAPFSNSSSRSGPAGGGLQHQTVRNPHLPTPGQDRLVRNQPHASLDNGEAGRGAGLQAMEVTVRHRGSRSSVHLVIFGLCRVCNEHEINNVFLPCGHFVMCHNCAINIRRCPECQHGVTACKYFYTHEGYFRHMDN